MTTSGPVSKAQKTERVGVNQVPYPQGGVDSNLRIAETNPTSVSPERYPHATASIKVLALLHVAPSSSPQAFREDSSRGRHLFLTSQFYEALRESRRGKRRSDASIMKQVRKYRSAVDSIIHIFFSARKYQDGWSTSTFCCSIISGKSRDDHDNSRLNP